MADSGLSASELRRRYHRGGDAQDDELSAAQLRARHGIAANKSSKNIISYNLNEAIKTLNSLIDFSTSTKGGVPVIAIIIVILVIVGAGVYLGIKSGFQ